MDSTDDVAAETGATDGTRTPRFSWRTTAVALVIAMVGVLGAIGGSVIAARTTTKTINAQIKASDNQHRQDLRANAYGQYLAVLQRLAEQMTELHDQGGGLGSALDNQISAAFQEVLAAESGALLFSRVSGHAVIGQAKAALDDLHRAARRDPGTDYPASLTGFSAALDRLIQDARDEVGSA